jgi:hypothetical protein
MHISYDQLKKAEVDKDYAEKLKTKVLNASLKYLKGFRWEEILDQVQENLIAGIEEIEFTHSGETILSSTIEYYSRSKND